MGYYKWASVNQSIHVFVASKAAATKGDGVTGLDAVTFPPVYYAKPQSTPQSVTLGDHSAITDPHQDGYLFEIGDGWYRLDLPDATFTLAGSHVVVYGSNADYEVIAPPIYVQKDWATLTDSDVYTVVGVNLQDIGLQNTNGKIDALTSFSWSSLAADSGVFTSSGTSTTTSASFTGSVDEGDLIYIQTTGELIRVNSSDGSNITMLRGWAGTVAASYSSFTGYYVIRSNRTPEKIGEIVSASIDRRIHVSPSGSDINGEGTVLSPYQTLTHARDQAVYGDTVFVHGGDHDLTTSDCNLAKNGVNWELDAGAVIQCDDDLYAEKWIFDDGGSTMSFKVTGPGKIIMGSGSGYTETPAGIVNTSAANSDVVIDVDSLISLGEGLNVYTAIVAQCTAGRQRIKARSSSGGESQFNATGGEQVVEVNHVDSTGAFGAFTCIGANTHQRVKVDSVVGGGNSVVYVNNGRQVVDIDSIDCDDNSAVYCNGGEQIVRARAVTGKVVHAGGYLSINFESHNSKDLCFEVTSTGDGTLSIEGGTFKAAFNHAAITVSSNAANKVIRLLSGTFIAGGGTTVGQHAIHVSNAGQDIYVDGPVAFEGDVHANANILSEVRMISRARTHSNASIATASTQQYVESAIDDITDNLDDVLTDVGQNAAGISNIQTAVSGLNDLDASGVISALTSYGGATSAEVAALHNLSSTDLDNALAAYDAPTKAEFDAGINSVNLAIGNLNDYDGSGVTTLLGRLTSTRANKLDHLDVNISGAVSQIVSIGNASWVTATGFATPGDAMSLTGAERDDVAQAVRGELDDNLYVSGVTSPVTTDAASRTASQVDPSAVASQVWGEDPANWQGGPTDTFGSFLDAAVSTRVPAMFTNRPLAVSASGEVLASNAAQPGDAMTLTSAERDILAGVIDARLLDSGDATDLIQAIVDRIGNTNVDQAVLVSAIRADLERAGGVLVSINDKLPANTASQIALIEAMRGTDNALLAVNYTSSGDAASIASAVRTELATELAFLDVSVSSRSGFDASTDVVITDAASRTASQADLSQVLSDIADVQTSVDTFTGITVTDVETALSNYGVVDVPTIANVSTTIQNKIDDLNDYDGSDTPGTTTLLARVTDARMTKLDVSGALAHTGNAGTFRATGFATQTSLNSLSSSVTTRFDDLDAAVAAIDPGDSAGVTELLGRLTTARAALLDKLTEVDNVPKYGHIQQHRNVGTNETVQVQVSQVGI